jgi:SAM-dependent MidA family methyltransferase
MWILAEIEARGGEVGFRDFMELALYHPEHGYYTGSRPPWGKEGDFLTAPTASGWYGATCAGFLGELAARTGKAFELVDLAAGDGTFLAAVVDGLGEEVSRVVTGVTAVERSPVMRDRAAQKLAGAPIGVRFCRELQRPGSGPVVVHASELYDAMPVHRVVMRPEGLMELTVAVTDDGLGWGSRPAGGELERYFSTHGVVLSEGQIAEVNLAAETFHRAVFGALRQGVALVLDYGHDAARLYDPRGRSQGSLVAYRRHQVGRDVLEAPGEQDLTAHVNWDDLRRAARACDWEELALLPLAEFLVRAGLEELLENHGLGMDADLDADTVAARQEVKRLLDPEGMGSDLKMLVQGRGELADVAREILDREI